MKFRKHHKSGYLPECTLMVASFCVGALWAMKKAPAPKSETSTRVSTGTHTDVRIAPELNVAKNATLSPLDLEALKFQTIEKLAPHGLECIPQEVVSIKQVSIEYLNCPSSALKSEVEGIEVSESFTVPTSLSRRFHFWRRIYSLWSKNQYVLHLAPWPEVVIESYHLKKRDQATAQQDEFLKVTTENRRLLYSQMLEEMQRRVRTKEPFSPAMERISNLMMHIEDPDKFQTAALALRVQRGQKDFVAQGLEVAPKYLPWIEREFASAQVPVELSRLAFIESSFNLKAVSKVGASGVFQIMPETGRQYLRIQEGIDERNDPIKAGKAAAKLLKFYHGMLHSWPLAITAYNHGIGGIRKAIEETGTDQLDQLILNYDGPAFGFASKNFYTGFLGLLATINQKELYFPDVKAVPPLNFKTKKLRTDISITTLQRLYGLKIGDIQVLNPDLAPQFIKSGGILPRHYVLKIPVSVYSKWVAQGKDPPG